MRQNNPTIDNNFVKGLITETTELTFPTNAAVETFDCVFNPIGYVTRRLGFDYEPSFVLNTKAIQTNEVFTEFLWTSVAGNGEITFLVQQQGGFLYFYDMSSTINPSSARKTFSVDLSDHVPSGSPLISGQYPCQYASGRGNLVVVNRAIDPFYVVYNSDSDSITDTSINIQIRDFDGLSDGLALTERPTATVTTLKATNPEHYYNLLNQGWYTADALAQWDTDRSDLPSNADTVSLYRASATDAYDGARVTAQSPGNTPAAKGHFILTATQPDRNAAMAADAFTGATIGINSVMIGSGVGTILPFDNVTSTLPFDDVTNSDAAHSMVLAAGFGGANTSAYGKDYSSTAQRIVSAKIFGSNDQGYMGGSGTTVATLYGSQTSPATATSGTSLGTISFTDTSNESVGRDITSSDQLTFWNYVWVYWTRAGVSSPTSVAEIQFFTADTDTGSGITVPSTTERPKTCCFFAGRTWYAGIDAIGLNNQIFFSQILQNNGNYGQCYQANDPTSEVSFNLLPSDGGVIVIPEIGSIRKLFAYQNALLIFSTNGVWLITGGSSGGFGGGFQANDYFVKKLTSVGTNAPLSVVDRRGVPMWFGEDGIYTVQYDPNFNSFNILNITFKSIRTFYLNIPASNREFIKAAYDPVFDIIYWIYNTDTSLATQDRYTYDAVLAYNGVSKAFYPWTIGDGVPVVRGVVMVQDAAHAELVTIKYTTTIVNGGSNEDLTYSEASSTTYLDWSTNATGIDYTSYLITAHKIDSKVMTYMEVPWVWVHLKNVVNSSCFVQGVFDFTTSPNSGKWSNRQQCYNSNLTTNRSLNFKRLRIRGRGKGLQLRFNSETGKPFQIQGWSTLGSIAGQP